MSRAIDLTEGSILRRLIQLALPIIGTSFVQMAYNLTDMIWVGRLSSDAVAAVGTAGFFTWLASAVILVARIGAEVGTAQSIGKKDIDEAKRFIRHSLQLILVLSVIYGALLSVFRHPLIGFYRLGPTVEEQARIYLLIVSIGMPFFTVNPVFTAIFNGAGDSSTPFKINVVGLITNIILDPILIFGLGPIPRMEVAGRRLPPLLLNLSLRYCFSCRQRNVRNFFRPAHTSET